MTFRRRNKKPEKKVLMAFKFRPSIAEFIRQKSQREHVPQVEFLETLIALKGRGLTFTARTVREPKI
jgi:hypothetical protein